VLAVAALVLAAGVALAAVRSPEPRLRRLHLPPAPGLDLPPSPPPSPGPPGSPPAPPAGPPTPPPPPLPRTVAVDETEYSIGLSRTVVGSGEVTFNVWNRGEDEHDLAVVDADGVVRTVDVPSLESRTLVVRLAPGRSKLYCSLFAGTAASHEALGMVAFIDVG
jgi:hypothetical protein